MKKILLFIALLFLPVFVYASDDVINNFDMNIYVDPNGTAHVTETWDATANMGTEFYHSYYNYGNSEFKDFTVTMDDKAYTNIGTWDLNASLEQKAYKNGFNYVDSGIELCFGKTSMGRHTYVSKYTISNFVLETTDSQIVYWTLLPYNNGGQFQNVHIKIYSDFTYEDTLEVWGYGNYGGTAYVYDGYIEMTSEGALDNSEYMTILVKYPLGSFTTTNKDTTNNFDYYYNMAEEGSTDYVDNSDNSFGGFFNIFKILWFIIFIGGPIYAIIKTKTNGLAGKYRLDFGKRGKKFDSNTPMFREIPCDKNIYDAYFISTGFNLIRRKTDFLGAILLKWLKEDKITTKKVITKILKREELAIDLKNSTFINSSEQELYNMMKTASRDGILESREFENWCDTNYSKILKWFDDALNNTGFELEEKGYLEKKQTGWNKYIVGDKMFEDANQLYGLRKFLIEFARMGEKTPIEVKLWEEYLMFAQIFGIAEEVAKQFKKLYPQVLEQQGNYDYNTFIFINHISYSGMQSASTAQMRAQSYSAGGGGFSSGGGGGGSSGGGGGGGAGGR
jgi:hypothetical protein